MDILIEIFWFFALYIAPIVFAIALVIFIHELGHYWMARYFGVRVQKFSIGFGKEIFGWNDKNNTRWCISRIPLGGYVEIFGFVNPDNPEIFDKDLGKKRKLSPEEMRVAYCTRAVWKRMLIVAAGPAINIIFAIALLTLMFSTIGQSVFPATVTAVAKDTAAYDAGFKVGDQILEIEGETVISFEDIWKYTKEEPGQPYTFTIKRNDKIIQIEATPRETEYMDDRGVDYAHGRLGAIPSKAFKIEDIYFVDGMRTKDNKELTRQLILEKLGREKVILGLRTFAAVSKKAEKDYEYFITYLPVEINQSLKDPDHEDFDKVFLVETKDLFHVRMNPLESCVMAVTKIMEGLDITVKVVSALITGKAREAQSPVGGVASMSEKAKDATKTGFYTFIVFIAVLSVQIGLINLFPIPVLDGGHLVFLSYEAISGKPVSERIQDLALLIGVVLLFGIMIIANLSDALSFIE